jgi:hypothetical protein
LAVEAASTVIFAAPQIDSKDLLACSELLAIRLGPHFLQAASSNRDRCVSAQVVRALSAPHASAADMHAYLAGIARSYNVQWTPEYRPSDVLSAISEILDKSNDTPAVDMSRLSKLCTFGIPDSPAWLRPRIWRLLLGTLPVLKASWDSEAQKHRENYYVCIGFSSCLGPCSHTDVGHCRISCGAYLSHFLIFLLRHRPHPPWMPHLPAPSRTFSVCRPISSPVWKRSRKLFRAAHWILRPKVKSKYLALQI